MKRVFSVLMIMLSWPALSYAGGLKGNLFSDEVIYAFITIVALIYISALLLALLHRNRGKTWSAVVSVILNTILFLPACMMAVYVPQIGIPLTIIIGINYFLLRKKAIPQHEETN